MKSTQKIKTGDYWTKISKYEPNYIQLNVDKKYINIVTDQMVQGIRDET